jgi:hypothetical protein
MVQQIQVLAMSARKQDVPIVVCGENEQFTTYTEAKIRRLCHWVTSLPSECKYILYADNDVGIVGNAEEILSRFLASQTPVLIGCERCCCPVCNSRAWIESFPEKTAGRNFVCAGCWMGTRSAVEYTLQALLNLHERLSRRAEEPSERTEDSPFRHACHRDNDQFLWQALYKLGLAEIALDDSFSLVANVTCENNRWHDPACAFRFQDGRLVDTESGNRPSAIHFSGGSRAFAHQWMGRLGATE